MRRLPSLVLAGVVFGAAPLWRILLLVEKDLPWTVQDARGFGSDLAVGALVAAVALGVSRWTRVGALLLAAPWLVLNAINYEHVRTFDAAVQPTYAAYLTDATFLQGSALQLTHPVVFFAALALLAVAAWRCREALLRPAAIAWSTGGAALVLAVTSLWPLHAHHQPWRQLHVLPLTARAAVAPELALPEASQEAAARVEEVYRRDLEGAPRAALGTGGRNVLIIAVEGLSGGYLPSVARYQGVAPEQQMPRLDETGRQGLVFESFLGHQRQTNRGLYAILCGDLPKLASEEARMSEYVRVAPERRRRCLPQILADAGYRTTFLQAAPLAFMMKDQFMKAAGFGEVHGTSSFPKAYARSRWGVDDRAFFEQAAERLVALDAADGGPWFATLLTVGTHHPFTVPEGAGGHGSHHARAIAYADQALDGLLRTLRDAGALDDTLVLITSDESAGINRGDDLTRGLSQNWLPLVVLGPDVPAGRVTERFSNADLATSVLDYLGLADRGPHLMGRSLFRSYDRDRPLYFANTYFRRGYVLEDGLLSLCGEKFDGCRSYAVDPDRPFGPARRPVAWQPERLTTWRAVHARTLEPLEALGAKRPLELTLVHRERVELHDREAQIIFGGQYLTAEPGSRYEVELDFEVERADGLVDAMHDLFGSGRVFHRAAIPLLGEGDRVRARYDFVFKEGMASMEARLNARAIHGERATVRIHRAVLKIVPGVGDGTWERLSVHHFEIQRRPRNDALAFSLENAAPFRRPRCMREDAKRKALVGTGCKATYPVFGPYAWASPGATVKAAFDVEVTKGQAHVRGDLVSDLSRVRHVMGERSTLSAGQRARLEVQFVADRQVEGIESRVELRPVGETVDVIVHAVSLTIEPAPASAAAAGIR